MQTFIHALGDGIARAKGDFEQIADLIKTKYEQEDQVISRVEQVQAAIQRLEWALERARTESRAPQFPTE
jgi:hypothetical protein